MKIKSRLWFVLLFMILLLINIVGPVFADEQTPITMDFKGADLRDVLRSIAQLADVNLITHQSVQGEITLTLKEVPFMETIELITMINDLEYRWVGNTLLIAGPTEITQNFSKIETASFDIEYAELDKVRGILEGLLLEEAIISTDERTGTLFVTTEQAKLEEVGKIVAKLDVPVPQIYLEVQVEEISTTGIEKLGIPQDQLESILQITSNNEDGFFDDISLKIPTVFDALKKDGLAKTLANPSLVALDGKTSHLLIGDKIPVESQETVDGQTQTVVKYIEAGIILEFTPRISSDGYITLQVKPQVSSLGEATQQGYNVIKSREVETEVRIKDGKTFVIGGLTREENRITEGKVPLLGDIPILGTFFRHNDETRQTTEIIIFITPRIIYPGEEDLQQKSDSVVEEVN